MLYRELEQVVSAMNTQAEGLVTLLAMLQSNANPASLRREVTRLHHQLMVDATMFAAMRDAQQQDRGQPCAWQQRIAATPSVVRRRIAV